MDTTPSRRRRLFALYGVATLIAAGFTAWGWLGDCAPHEVDGQCGMSTAFGAAIGLISSFILLALGHWLPALYRVGSRSRPSDPTNVATDEVP